MKSIATIGLGVVIGILITYLFMAKSGNEEAQETVKPDIEQVQDSVEVLDELPDDREYFSIQMKNKEVMLYVGMPKSEARQLLGKPNSTRVMTILDQVHETWNYRENYTQVEFIDGNLHSVIQL